MRGSLCRPCGSAWIPQHLRTVSSSPTRSTSQAHAAAPTQHVHECNPGHSHQPRGVLLIPSLHVAAHCKVHQGFNTLPPCSSASRGPGCRCRTARTRAARAPPAQMRRPRAAAPGTPSRPPQSGSAVHGENMSTPVYVIRRCTLTLGKGTGRAALTLQHTVQSLQVCHYKAKAASNMAAIIKRAVTFLQVVHPILCTSTHFLHLL